MAGAFSHSNTMESNTVVVSMSLKIKNGKAVGVPQQLIHMAVMTETFTTNIPTLGDTAIDRMIKWLQYHTYGIMEERELAFGANHEKKQKL